MFFNKNQRGNNYFQVTSPGKMFLFKGSCTGTMQSLFAGAVCDLPPNLMCQIALLQVSKAFKYLPPPIYYRSGATSPHFGIFQWNFFASPQIFIKWDHTPSKSANLISTPPKTITFELHSPKNHQLHLHPPFFGKIIYAHLPPRGVFGTFTIMINKCPLQYISVKLLPLAVLECGY